MSHQKQAIVIGSGMAGLVTAQVLTEQFAEVIIIERDALIDIAAPRNGVPQGRQPHILLKRGETILEMLFPGIVNELKGSGAVSVNAGRDLRWFVFGQWRPSYDSAIDLLGLSRPLLETTVRQRLRANPRVTFLPKSEVVGLETNADGTQAVGVRIFSREDRSESRLTADFIVDTSGRDSDAPRWLEALGFTAPEQTVVNSFAGYASRLYKAKPGVNWKAMYVQTMPPYFPRGVVILPMEGDVWQVGLTGMAKDYPPTDEQGYMDFLASLPTQEPYELLKDAEPLSPIYGFRRSENRLYHYERLPHYLENFVVLGDSLYAFNPVYGQGISVAAMSALELGNCLREHTAQNGDLTGLAMQFQQRVAEVLAFPWQLAISEDAHWPTTEGNLPAATPTDKLMQNYLVNVLMAANSNPNILEAFYSVQHMMASPEIFFRPDIVMQVMALSNAVIPELAGVAA